MKTLYIDVPTLEAFLRADGQLKDTEFIHSIYTQKVGGKDEPRITTLKIYSKEVKNPYVKVKDIVDLETEEDA